MKNNARAAVLAAVAAQARNVPDEMLLDMVDQAPAGSAIAAILTAEMDARTAPKFNGLASILAAHGL